MKFLWVLLVAVFTVNVSNAKSIIENVSENVVNKNAISKMLNPSQYVTRRNSSIFPNMPARSNKFVVSIKPTMKTESPTTKPDNYRKRLMKKLPITYVNSNVKLPVQTTTRRSLMKIRKFTVKPHDIFAESVRERYNWNSNRKTSSNNFRKPKSERYATEKNVKPIDEDESSEQRFLNFKNIDSSINDNDSDEFGNEDKESYVAAGSQKSSTILLFPKRNNTKKYLKVNPEQKNPERKYKNKSDSEKKILSYDVNNQRENIPKDLKKSIDTDEVSIIPEPKNIFSDKEKADRNEFKFVYGVKKDEVLFVPVIDDVEMSTDSDLDFFVL